MLNLASDCAGLEPLSLCCQPLELLLRVTLSSQRSEAYVCFPGDHMRLAGFKSKLIFASEFDKALRDRIAAVHSPVILSDDAHKTVSSLACRGKSSRKQSAMMHLGV